MITAARQQLAFGLGKAAGIASRLSGRGTGASIRGAVMTKVDPGLFRRLIADKRIAVVSGTNGKTTTTHLLTAALRESVADPRDVVTNPDGANLREGVVSAISTRPKAPIAILEVDEQVVPDMVKYGHPEVLIMLNFSRDQLDRHHEINALGRKWRKALTEAGEDGPTVVANASDPLIAWSAQPAKKIIWVDMGTGWSADSALCPACGAIRGVWGRSVESWRQTSTFLLGFAAVIFVLGVALWTWIASDYSATWFDGMIGFLLLSPFMLFFASIGLVMRYVIPRLRESWYR